ncbi:serine/threonine-protein kinase [Arthrobacter crusticola]|nr:serine/threonine-protein kinase [Arthrobacter crusticola]
MDISASDGHGFTDPGAAPVPDGGYGDAGPPPSVQGFETGRLLGRGGSSSVWLVTAHDGGGVFALKVGFGGLSGADSDGTDPGLAEGLVHREADVMGGLCHEHLVTILGIVATDRGPGALMDYAPGGSLQNLVAVRGPLPICEAVTVLVPVAQALAYLHGQGVSHGDVTPSNILFTEEGKPLLSDFELGRRLGEGLRRTAGTPGFRDPRPSEPGCLGTEADVFALGAVAWFTLTGRVPGQSAQRPPLSMLVPEIPPRFLALIEEALSEDPMQRPDAVSFARGSLRAGTAVPVGLVEAVEEDVRPRLLTRRDAAPNARPWGPLGRIGSGGRRSGRSGARTAFGSRKGRSRSRARAPGSRTDSRPAEPRRRAAAAGTGRRSAARTGPGPVPSSIPRSIPRWIAAGVLAVLLAVGAVWAQGEGGRLRLPERPPEALESLGAPDRAEAHRPSVTPATPKTQPAPDNPKPSRPPAPEPDPAVDPLKALPQLSQQRAAAFARADPAVLDEVNTRGSPAMASDLREVTALAEAGRRLTGLRLTVIEAQIVESPAAKPPAAIPRGSNAPADGGASRTAVVTATMEVSAHTELDSAGAAVSAEVPPRRQELVFVLREEDGWKIHSVYAAVPGP